MKLDGMGVNRKIFVVGGGKSYANWMQGVLVDSLEEANLIVFTGGQDICPLVYNEKNIHPSTYYTLTRDDEEIKAYEKALKLGKKMIGICRGHQLLSALNGAVLIQDQNNPGSHLMTTYQNESFMINSLHHQAVFPFDLPEEDYNILGYSKHTSSYHHNGLSQEMNPPVEVEAIYFPKTNCLGIQCHPEMMGGRHSNSLYTKALNFFTIQLNRFMLDIMNVDQNENNKLKKLYLEKI